MGFKVSMWKMSQLTIISSLLGASDRVAGPVSGVLSNDFITVNVLENDCAPIIVGPSHTVTSLYDLLYAQCACSPREDDIRITFEGKIILKLINDHRTIKDIGISKERNEIGIIEVPDYVALLEMVVDIDNMERIPWFNGAVRSLSDYSDSSAKHCQSVSHYGRGLDYNDKGFLVLIDLSHLNLKGIIHVGSLPRTVETLDLSFNDLSTVNLNGLNGLNCKSLKRLHIEHNDKLEVDIDHNNYRFPDSVAAVTPSRTLKLSSNQIFASTSDLREKKFRIQTWLYRQPYFDRLILDGKRILRKVSAPFYVAMLNVVDGITNKQQIPWYKSFVNESTIATEEWSHLRVTMYGANRKGKHCRFCFDLSGLGLEGHIELASLPRAVVKLDLSNNNLSSISLTGGGHYRLHELNLQNNNHLRIDLAEFSKAHPSLLHLNTLQSVLISSNQLVSDEGAVEVLIREWLAVTKVGEIVLDDVSFRRNQAFYRSEGAGQNVQSNTFDRRAI